MSEQLVRGKEGYGCGLQYLPDIRRIPLDDIFRFARGGTNR